MSIATKSEFGHLAHILSMSHRLRLFVHPSASICLPQPSLSPALLLPACLYLSFMPSAVKWRMSASAGTLAGVASVLRAESVLEASVLALFQGTDSTLVTTLANVYSTCSPSIKMGFY